MSVCLNVYGLRIRIGGDWGDVIEAARLDYAWFEAPDDGRPVDAEVRVDRDEVDLDQFSGLPAAFVTPRYAVFGDGDRTVVDYQGVASAVIDAGGDRVTVRGQFEDVAHEAVYYFLLGRIGRHLDVQGLTRVHALGLSGEDGGVLVLLPSSGGKSSLAVQAVAGGEAGLYSEDSPLLDREGRLHAFPLRIAVGARTAAQLPERPTRSLPNPATGQKLAIEVASFADRIESAPAPLRHVVLGVRSLSREASLEDKTRGAAVFPLLVHGVAGSGLYQGLGYAHQRGAGEVIAKLRLAASRARSCAVGLRGARVWQLTLARDPDASWQALRPLLGRLA
jgi:hypothetical protein